MLKRLLASAAIALTLSLPSQAAPIVIAEDLSAPVDIPGLTGFATNGAQMDGLRVVACFTGGCAPALFWADNGATSGGVTGAGWTLSLAGDSFNTSWVFTINPNANLGQLVSLLLDGSSGFTIFDRTLPSFGTDGSAQGLDFNTAAGLGQVDVLYSGPTGIGGAAPVGDLFQSVFIDFHGDGPRVDFTFVQDTDNDIRITQVPEPGSLVLLAIGALALGLARRRRS